MNWGLLGPTDAVDDVVDVRTSRRRLNLAYHRNDGHVYQQGFGDRSQFLPERTLQVFEADLHGVVAGDRLHTAAKQAHRHRHSTRSSSHCECRIGIFTTAAPTASARTTAR